MSENYALPSGWSWVTLGEISEPISHVDPSLNPKKAFRYVDISSISNETFEITKTKEYIGAEAPSRARKLIRTGDILVSTVRTYLRNVTRVPRELDGEICSTGLCVLRPIREMADPLVVFRYVLTQEFANRLTREQRGINYPAVTDRRVYAQPIPLPPLAEQERIAARLEDLFSSIQEAKKSLRSVPTPQMFLQSILAKAFENCEVRGLYEIAHVFNGRAVGSGLSKTRVFKTRHVYPSGLKMDNPSYLKLEQEKYIGPDRFLRDGDVLIVNTWQNLGRVCYVDQPQSRWTVDTQISVVRPKEGSLGKFIFYFLLSKRGYDLLLSCERGALTAGRSRKLTHIYPKDIEKITIPHVSPDQQASVVKRIDLSLKYVSAMGISMQLARTHIGSLEKSILHKAFHGKLVPQDRNDEPASVLLERIRTQRATMGKKTVHRGREKFASPRAIAN